MTQPLNSDELRLLISAAATIAPQQGVLPSAATLRLEAEFEQVLNARADMCDTLVDVLTDLEFPVNDEQLHQLQRRNPSGLRSLVTIVCAAYYLHRDVREALDYPGQQALALSRGGFGAEELVARQMQRPKRFRQP